MASWLAMFLATAAFPAIRPPDLAELVEVLVEPIRMDRPEVGLVVGIWNGEKSWTRGFGKVSTPKGEHPPDAATLFEIGSVTKGFTGILLAEAVRRREVALEDPLNRHLPPDLQWKGKTETPITLLHLGTHRSGVPVQPPLIGLLAKNPANPYSDFDRTKLGQLCEKARKFREPGEVYEYSNLGMGLLGHALVHAAKADSFHELVRDRISKPLGLRDTTEALTGEQKARLARGHSPSGKPVESWDFATLSAAGALRSTVADLLIFARANSGDLKGDLLPAMQESHRERAKVDANRLTIGLGWHRMRLKGNRECVWHNGRTGGYQAMLAFTPGTRRAVVILCAASGVAELDSIAIRLLERIQPK
jgi:CubicO group peptidase (beta-lactamase class C family)